MAKDEVLTVKDAVHKLQLSLLEGIKHENQLLAAGSLISRSDYQDVVTERTIVNMCGYPLCNNSLPSERPSKGRYRISLKEHKVYDIQETYLYCSSSCLINSRAFAGSLQEERSSTLNSAKINEILKVFEGLTMDSAVSMGKNGDLGLSELKIQEKTDKESGEAALEEWVGPSNAIEGYVPRSDRNLKPQKSNNLEKGAKQEQGESKQKHAQPDIVNILSNDLNFSSTIIIQDEYSISKTPPPVKVEESEEKVCNEASGQRNKIPKPASPSVKIQESRSKKLNRNKNVASTSGSPDIPGHSRNVSGNDNRAGSYLGLATESAAGATALKSSLRTLGPKKATRSVTWADGKLDGDAQSLCESREVAANQGAVLTSHSVDNEVGEESYRFQSAEACARALSEAAEAVASGKSDVSDAVSEAGVIILSPPDVADDTKSQENNDAVDTDPVLMKWPPKPGFSESDLLDSEDSWYDSPPEGFNLTLSPFSSMFMALFAWTSCSSLAYIYGKEDSFHEEYLSVNGREYPRRIVMPDGRSSEIKQTLAGCLARALPGLVAELRLSIPISTLEQGLGRLLNTMSFMDPLPALRMKQWQVIVLLFLEALSVSRIPALTPYMMGRRILLPKVLEGAQISVEEFEIMKDLILPLGRVPQFSTQSGG